MKKILYVDLACPKGHANYNRNMISALEQVKDVKIDFFFQKGYTKRISETFFLNKKVFEVPSYKSASLEVFNSTKFRWHQIKLQNTLYKVVKQNKYDFVFISSFEIGAFIFFKKLPCKTLAICHNEIDAAVSKKSVWVLNLLSKRCNLVAINKSGYDYLRSLGVKSYMIPHGFPQPFTQELIQACRQVYIPINGAIDWDIVRGLLTEKFNDILKVKNARLIIKTRDKSFEAQYAQLSQISFLVGYIDDETYKKAMLESSIIILPYVKEEYQYRCSAILMEAIINNKTVILPDMAVFRELSQQGDRGLYYYDDLSRIIEIIKNFDFEHNHVHYDNVQSLYSRDMITACFNAIIHEK